MAELQQGLRSLIQPNPPDRSAASVLSEVVLNSVNETAVLSRHHRLAIYARAYQRRLTRALAKLYPALRGSLGDEAFNAFAMAYAQKFPSPGRSLVGFGDRLPSFMDQQAAARKSPWLVDLARLEWAVVESMQAGARRRGDLKGFSNIPEADWQAARLQLNPTVRLFQSPWAVDNLWGARDRDKRPDVREYALWLLIARVEKNITLERLSRAQWHFLKRIQDGVPLGTIAHEMHEDLFSTRQESSVMHWFKDWVSRGILRSVEFHR